MGGVGAGAHRTTGMTGGGCRVVVLEEQHVFVYLRVPRTSSVVRNILCKSRKIFTT